MQEAVSSPYLKIGTDRLCGCPPNHISCIDARSWLKAQIGVWRFAYEGRDIRDKEKHPATFPIALPARLIQLFTHRGELVLDPFVGSGTTLIAARDLDRNCVGFDLNPAYIHLAAQRLSQLPLISTTQQLAICDDARSIPRYLQEESVSLIVTSPPYANLLNRRRKNKSRRGDLRRSRQYGRIEQYSQDPRDLGTLAMAEYSAAMADIFASLLPLLRRGAHCVINIADSWWENQHITLHIGIINALTSVGYDLRNIIIWDKTNVVNRVGIFGWPSNYITMATTFEYIIDFWRP